MIRYNCITLTQGNQGGFSVMTTPRALPFVELNEQIRVATYAAGIHPIWCGRSDFLFLSDLRGTAISFGTFSMG